jgi:hypothetical protein
MRVQGSRTMPPTKKKFGATDRMRIAVKWQHAGRKSWVDWREAGKEPKLEEAKKLLLDALGEMAGAVATSKVGRGPDGRLDLTTSFILWDMIENANRFFNHVHDSAGDIQTFLFVNVLYTHAHEYVFGAPRALQIAATPGR